ncbi:MAG TPA: hypothetical protein VFA92_08250 [Candidatus Binatia bacterium]|nr:hypothetical protein [Candidatus Binatia bacterium]
MLACPRCGSEAQYLADDVFSLVRCEFCGEDLDAPTWCCGPRWTASP